MTSKVHDDEVLTPLLPSSISQDNEVQNISQAYSPRLKEISEHLNDALYLYRLDDLNTSTLDHLAKQWNVYTWRDNWPVELKRSVLRLLIPQVSHLGTLGAIKEILKGFGTAAYITEWWQKEPKGIPHTFEIAVDQNKIEEITEAEQLETTYELINYAKPVRSQFTLSVIQKGSATLGEFQLGRTLTYARLSFEDSNIIESSQIQALIRGARPVLVKRLSNY